MKNRLLLLNFLLWVGTVWSQSPHAPQLYGLIEYGGPDHNGSLFHFTPETRAVSVDYDFAFTVQGKSPQCDLVSGNNGVYYGTTTAGGPLDAGVIFAWDSATGSYSEPYFFNGTDGRTPRGGMALYNGKLYGMTAAGGMSDFGTLYEWDFALNVFTKRIDFDSLLGKRPTGTLAVYGSVLYGFTSEGGAYDKGVLFSWDPATNLLTKHFDFDSISGSNPVGKLVEYNNRLYAMCSKGGTMDYGTIIEWDPATSTLSRKHDFDFINGSTPLGSLTFYNGKFYGLTRQGGIYEVPNSLDYGGVVFEWNPANSSFIKKLDLGKDTAPFRSGGSLGSLTLAGNVFWGSTSIGLNANGAMFRWDPATNDFTELFLNRQNPFSNRTNCDEYRNPSGIYCYSTLLLSGNHLLGASFQDGSAGFGCLFDYSIDSNQVVRAVHMRAADGKYPRGSLTRVGHKLYGVTTYGGQNHLGNIFSWDLRTRQFRQELEFDGTTTGIQIQGELTYFNGLFYGCNKLGAIRLGGIWSSFFTRDYGEIFSWNPQSSEYRRLHNDLSGGFPPISFTALNNKLYTAFNGVSCFDPVQGTFQQVASMQSGSFTNLQDNVTMNNLVAHAGKLYGTTPSRWVPGTGNDFKGVIYEWDTVSSTVTDRVFLDVALGTYPSGSMVWVDSVFYGLTTGSGGGIGSLFRWNPVTNVAVNVYDGGMPGTPVASSGKIYFFGGYLAPYIMEYDPALDTVLSFPLPTYPGNGTPYGWFDFVCLDNAYPTLLEVIPNSAPQLVLAPDSLIVCQGQDIANSFIITDADGDTLDFTFTSSQPTVVPASALLIDRQDSLYTVTAGTAANATGSSIISIIARDGYGDSLVFSFPITIEASPVANVIDSGSFLVATPDSAAYDYAWLDCTTGNLLPGANAVQYAPLATGSFAVIETNRFGCVDTSTCVQFKTIGIGQVAQEGFASIRPNPCRGAFLLSLSQASQMEIIDPTGACVFRESFQAGDHRIALPAPAAGLYAVILTNEHQSTLLRLLVQ